MKQGPFCCERHFGVETASRFRRSWNGNTTINCVSAHEPQDSTACDELGYHMPRSTANRNPRSAWQASPGKGGLSMLGVVALSDDKALSSVQGLE